MFKQTIETSATPHLTVTECWDNLVVRGGQDNQITIRVQGDADDLTVDGSGEAVTLAARSGCTLSCPRATTLSIDSVQGNLKVDGISGAVAVGTVHGNATLRAVGPSTLEQAFGNLSVVQAEGDLRAQVIRGNTQVRRVDGLLSLDLVDGNLRADGLRGGLEAGRVHANVRLGPPFSSGQTYRLNANGNLALRLPAGASLRLALNAGGRVRSHVPGLTLEKADRHVEGVVGAGEASLEAQVGGNVHLRPLEPGQAFAHENEFENGDETPFDFAADVEGLSAQVEARVAEAVAEMEAHLQESLGRIDQAQIRRQVERTMEQAGRSAEHQAERARLRAERAERRWRRASGRQARPRRSRATDEERMRVLRLVEEGKIDPQQAADLLSALEGR